MADDNKNKRPELAPVSAPENATIGDENLPGPADYEVDVNDEAVTVPRTGPEYKIPEQVPVFEVVVHTDRVITDPNDPLAVQVPDAGRGDPLLPIHAHVGARRVEDIFAEEAGGSEPSKVSDEERAESASTGTTPKSARSSKKS